MKKYPKIGFLLANPDRIVEDTFKVEKCGTENVQVCKDMKSGTASTERQVVSFDFHGETFVAQKPIPLKEVEMVKEFLMGIIRKFEGNIWVKFKTEVTGQSVAYDIQHIGKAALTAIKLDDGSEIALDRCCDMVTQYKFAAIVVGDVAQLRYKDKSAQLANNPYPFIGNEATNLQTAEQLKTDVEAAFTTLEIETSKVEVSPIDNGMVYQICYWSNSDTPVNIGETSFENCGSEDIWTCK